MTVKKRGLAKGRGLDALLGSIQKEKLQLEAQSLDHGQLKQLNVHLLKRGEYQPRRSIKEQDLQELAASIEALLMYWLRNASLSMEEVTKL